MSLTECGNCGHSCVPRLWHYGGGFLTERTREHLCPFCGVVMYRTGGGFNGIARFLFWFQIVPLSVLLLLALLVSALGRLGVPEYVLSIVGTSVPVAAIFLCVFIWRRRRRRV